MKFVILKILNVYNFDPLAMLYNGANSLEMRCKRQDKLVINVTKIILVSYSDFNKYSKLKKMYLITVRMASLLIRLGVDKEEVTMTQEIFSDR